MIEIKDVLNLLGRELKDKGEQAKRFRKFIEQEKWGARLYHRQNFFIK